MTNSKCTNTGLSEQQKGLRPKTAATDTDTDTDTDLLMDFWPKMALYQISDGH